MGPEGYQLRFQLGAGRDGIAFCAMAPDSATTVLVLDLTLREQTKPAGQGWLLSSASPRGWLTRR